MNLVSVLAPLFLLVTVTPPSPASPPSAAVVGPEVHRQDEPPVTPPALPPPPSAEDALAALRTELEAARERLASTPEDAAGARPAHLAREVQLYERIEAQLMQQVRLAGTRDSQEDARGALELELETVQTSGLPGPFTYQLLDAARDQLREDQARRQRLVDALQIARDASKKARDEHDAKERARRKAKDEVTGAPEDATLVIALRHAELESRAAAETATLRLLEVEALAAEQSVMDLRVQLEERRVELLRERTALTDEDRGQILLGLAQQEEGLRRASELAQRDLDYLDGKWATTKTALDQQGGSDPVLTEELDALRAGQRHRRRELVGIAKRLERIADLRIVHERRFQLYQDTAPRSELAVWRIESEGALGELDLQESLANGHLADLQGELAAVGERIASAAVPAAAPALQRHRRHLESLVAEHRNDIVSVQAARRLHEKLLEDVAERSQRFDVGRGVRAVWSRVVAVWGTEITSVDDNPITVGKVINGLILLILGTWLSKRASRFVSARLLSRLNLHEGAVQALQTVLFYVLVVTTGLFALRVVSVPLTAFTILGGALAIGLGFGSQNIVNNFISGLILLAERPVRAGDLIQLDELYGTVVHIGPRSTRIQTGDNVEIIVPNSSFLEQNVVNWTLSSTTVRAKVIVGVAYGSVTRDVRELLRRAAAEHGRVLKSPEPFVIFANFGESSLDFEVHFWIHMRSLTDRRIVESDIRFRIDSLFREAGIVIAFPQRDVHVDGGGTFDVRLLRDGETPPAPAEASAPSTENT